MPQPRTCFPIRLGAALVAATKDRDAFAPKQSRIDIGIKQQVRALRPSSSK
jgi:hypothetical protein